MGIGLYICSSKYVGVMVMIGMGMIWRGIFLVDNGGVVLVCGIFDGFFRSVWCEWFCVGVMV